MWTSRSSGRRWSDLTTRGGRPSAPVSSQPAGSRGGSSWSRPNPSRFGITTSVSSSETTLLTAMLTSEITPVTIAQKKGDAIVVSQDEHPRATSLETLAKLNALLGSPAGRAYVAWRAAEHVQFGETREPIVQEVSLDEGTTALT